MQLLLAGEMFPTCGLATPATTPPLAASRAECGHGIEKTCAYHLNLFWSDATCSLVFGGMLRFHRRCFCAHDGEAGLHRLAMSTEIDKDFAA